MGWLTDFTSGFIEFWKHPVTSVEVAYDYFAHDPNDPNFQKTRQFNHSILDDENTSKRAHPQESKEAELVRDPDTGEVIQIIPHNSPDYYKYVAWESAFREKLQVLTWLDNAPKDGLRSWLTLIGKEKPGLIQLAESVIKEGWLANESDILWLGKESEELKHYQKYLDELYWISHDGKTPPSGEQIGGGPLDEDVPEISDIVALLKNLLDFANPNNWNFSKILIILIIIIVILKIL